MGDRKALEAELDYVKDLPGYKKSNPQYFSDPMIDKLLEITLLIGGELWAVRDRQMVTEHLLATKGVVTPDLIETFKQDPVSEAQSQEQRIQFIQRIFSCLYGGAPLSANKNQFSWLTDKKTSQDQT